MKQTIINVILGVLCIFFAACSVYLFFTNASLKRKVQNLNQRLEYEEQLLDDNNNDSGGNDPGSMSIQSDSTDNEDEASKIKETAETTSTENSKTNKEEKVDLSNMETLEAQTVIPENQIDMSNLDQYFKAYPISDELFDRIYGDNCSYKTDCTVPREDLSYIKVLHYGYDGKIKVGEMIVNTLIQDDVLYIFKSLFENQYQIEKMILVEAYDADDDASVNDNNTSCFNFRTATDSDELSAHATGCAIDINPLQNPYFRVYDDGTYDWDNTGADKYWDRTDDPEDRHMITENDLCYQLFTECGFTWGGSWQNPIDYQHFEKRVY